jgi:hypothetical protein
MRAARRLWLLCGIVLGVAAGCASALPHATESDAVRAKTRWPRTSVVELELGRDRYAHTCAGCHNLKLPSELPPERWAPAIHEMETEHGVKLSERDQELIIHYLVTFSSQRATGPTGGPEAKPKSSPN